jgi:hypothetical protein
MQIFCANDTPGLAHAACKAVMRWFNAALAEVDGLQGKGIPSRLRVEPPPIEAGRLRFDPCPDTPNDRAQADLVTEICLRLTWAALQRRAAKAPDPTAPRPKNSTAPQFPAGRASSHCCDVGPPLPRSRG